MGASLARGKMQANQTDSVYILFKFLFFRQLPGKQRSKK
jgi:hypothetical protein